MSGPGLRLSVFTCGPQVYDIGGVTTGAFSLAPVSWVLPAATSLPPGSGGPTLTPRRVTSEERVFHRPPALGRRSLVFLGERAPPVWSQLSLRARAPEAEGNPSRGLGRAPCSAPRPAPWHCCVYVQLTLSSLGAKCSGPLTSRVFGRHVLW